LRVVETENFKRQLRIISFTIKNDKPSAALKFVKDLKKQTNEIANMSYKYRKSYYYNDEKVRDMIFRGYTIIYKIYDNYIAIAEIFNQNLPTVKKEQSHS